MPIGIRSTLFPVEGKVFGSSHWQDMRYKKDGTSDTKYGVYDTSAAVDGKAPVYQRMGYANMLDRSIKCIISAPFYIVGTAAYYLIRIIPVTIWIIGGIIVERTVEGCKKCMGLEEIPIERKYKWKHIPQEAYYSLKQIVKTGGYGLGYFAGLCMSIFSPLNGWKIASSYEKAWSDGADHKTSSPSALLLMMALPCIVLPALLTLPYFFNPYGVVIFTPYSAAFISSTLTLTCCVTYTILAPDWKSSYHPHGYVAFCRQPIGHVVVPDGDEEPTEVQSFHGKHTYTLMQNEEKKGCMPAGCYPNTVCCYEPPHPPKRSEKPDSPAAAAVS